MKRIDSDGHKNNRFVDQDPAKAIAGTVVSAEWLNAVQEELVALATMNGEALDANFTDQAKRAVKQIVLNSVNHNMLPVFTYKLKSVSGRKMIFDLSLYWKGKTWQEEDFEFNMEKNTYIQLISYDPELDKIVSYPQVFHRMPLLVIYYDHHDSTPRTRRIRHAITLWSSSYNYRTIGGHSSIPPLADENLFAWVPAEGKQDDNSVKDVELIGNKKLENCTIDMRDIPLKYRRSLNAAPLQLSNCVLKNVVKANRVQNGGTHIQFAIHGTGNHIHLNDSSKVAFMDSSGNSTADGNTIYVPRDTADNFYRGLAYASAKKNKIEETTDTANNDYHYSAGFDYFNVFVGGQKLHTYRVLNEILITADNHNNGNSFSKYNFKLDVIEEKEDLIYFDVRGKNDFRYFGSWRWINGEIPIDPPSSSFNIRGWFNTDNVRCVTFSGGGINIVSMRIILVG